MTAKTYVSTANARTLGSLWKIGHPWHPPLSPQMAMQQSKHQHLLWICKQASSCIWSEYANDRANAADWNSKAYLALSFFIHCKVCRKLLMLQCAYMVEIGWSFVCKWLKYAVCAQVMACIFVGATNFYLCSMALNVYLGAENPIDMQILIHNQSVDNLFISDNLLEYLITICKYLY